VYCYSLSFPFVTRWLKEKDSGNIALGRPDRGQKNTKQSKFTNGNVRGSSGTSQQSGDLTAKGPSQARSQEGTRTLEAVIKLGPFALEEARALLDQVSSSSSSSYYISRN
jgi:hypothetical protein